MSRWVGLAAFGSLLGCAGPRTVAEPPDPALAPLVTPNTTSIAATITTLATPATVAASATVTSAEPTPGGVPAMPTPETRSLVAHDYHRVFQGWSLLLLLAPEPYLFTLDGVVNLATGTVEFQRNGSNFTVHEGDSVWFADGFSPMSACPQPSTLVQRVGKKWLPRFELNVHSLAVHAWVKGSSLAAIVPFRSGPPWGYELTVLERNRKAPRPARRLANQVPECETRIAWFQTLVAFPSGEVFAFGSECERVQPDEPPACDDPAGCSETADPGVDPDRVNLPPNVMESWHQGRHEFIEVPFRELGRVSGVGPKDLWAAGTRADETWAVGYFDGGAWQLLPETYESPITALRVYPGESGRDARRLILTTQQLFEVNQGTTIEHALPAHCTAQDVTLDGEELWVACDEDGQETLYTTRRDIAEFRFATDAPDHPIVTFTDKVHPRIDPKAPSLRSCGSREFAAPEFPTPEFQAPELDLPRPFLEPAPKPLPRRGKSGSKLH